MNKFSPIQAGSPRRSLRMRAFVAATAFAVFGLVGSAAIAQSTDGAVFGSAPAGDSVLALNTSNAVQRTVQVDARGRYFIHALPVGVYEITLSENGKAVMKHVNVPVVVGRGIKVDFGCPQDQCAKSE